MLAAVEAISIARVRVIEHFPYFHSAILGLVLKEAPGLGTIGVTPKGHLLYDPVAVEKWTVKQTTGALIHELMHVLFEHHDRCEAIFGDHELFNIASDLPINMEILQMGSELELPPDCITCKSFTPPLPEGKVAEEYYWMLKERYKLKCFSCGAPLDAAGKDIQDGIAGTNDVPGSGKSDKSDKKGKGKQKGGGTEEHTCSEGQSEDQGNQPSNSGGSGGGHICNGKASVGRGWCGSGGGRAVEGEPDDNTDKDCHSGADWDRYREQVAAAINQPGSTGRGTVPAGLKRWADALMAPPKIPWQTKLKRTIRRNIAFIRGMTDYTYSRPSRRQASIGYQIGKPILPALWAPVPLIGIAIDTSGSMGTEDLNLAVREAVGVLRATGTAVNFYACDAEVGAAISVKCAEDILDNMVGGGGTDFSVVFEYISNQQKGKQPHILIYLTDGICNVPDNQPDDMKVIWVIVGKGHTDPGLKGEVIICDE